MNRSSIASLLAASVLALVGANLTLGAGDSASSCCAEPASTPNIATKRTLTLEGANRVLAAAVADAKQRSAGGAIAVVDDAGSLIAFQRLDGTFSAGATVSIGKARTAAMFKKPTKAFEDAIKNGRTALVGVGELTPLQGGVPIEYMGEIIGAIGVSGAHSQAEDEQIAFAGANAVGDASAAESAGR